MLTDSRTSVTDDVPKMAAGGIIGGSELSDRIPILARGGEAIIPQDVVAKNRRLIENLISSSNRNSGFSMDRIIDQSGTMLDATISNVAGTSLDLIAKGIQLDAKISRSMYSNKIGDFLSNTVGLLLSQSNKIITDGLQSVNVNKNARTTGLSAALSQGGMKLLTQSTDTPNQNTETPILEEVAKVKTPTVTPEQVSGASLNGKRGMMSSVYNAFVGAGFSEAQAKALTAEVGRENDFSSKNVFGTHIDAANNAKNLGFFSWQGDRATKLQRRLEEKGLFQDGTIVQSQDSLNEMANFARMEMESGQYRGLGDFLQNENVDSETAAKQLGKGYIKWAYGQDTLRSGRSFDWRRHDAKRKGYYDELTNIAGEQRLQHVDTLQNAEISNQNLRSASQAAMVSGPITSAVNNIPQPRNVTSAPQHNQMAGRSGTSENATLDSARNQDSTIQRITDRTYSYAFA
jgi:hypothetical protein